MSYKKLIRRWDSEREVFYDDIFNHFYAVRPGRYRTRWNNANEGPLRRSRSFKVTDFCTNRKFMYNFLIVINNNLPPIFHHLRDMVFDRSKIVILGYLATALTFNPPPRRRGSLYLIVVSDISLKCIRFGLHLCRTKFGQIFNHFYAVRPGSYRIPWHNAK